MREVENPMVNDDYWAELEQIDDEEWYRKCDEAYEYELEQRAEDAWLARMEEEEAEEEGLSFFAWSRLNDGYHF